LYHSISFSFKTDGEGVTETPMVFNCATSTRGWFNPSLETRPFTVVLASGTAAGCLTRVLIVYRNDLCVVHACVPMENISDCPCLQSLLTGLIDSMQGIG